MSFGPRKLLAAGALLALVAVVAVLSTIGWVDAATGVLLVGAGAVVVLIVWLDVRTARAVRTARHGLEAELKDQLAAVVRRVEALQADVTGLRDHAFACETLHRSVETLDVRVRDLHARLDALGQLASTEQDATRRQLDDATRALLDRLDQLG